MYWLVILYWSIYIDLDRKRRKKGLNFRYIEYKPFKRQHDKYNLNRVDVTLAITQGTIIRLLPDWNI